MSIELLDPAFIGDFFRFGFLTLPLLLTILTLAGMWKTFEKADRAGWAAIIPIYNLYIILKIVGRPGWWLLLFFIPIVNFIIGIVVLLDLARAFGKDILYALGLLILGFIFWPLLGFGEAQYEGAPHDA